MSLKQRLFKLFSVIAILAMTFSNQQSISASAQGGDGLKRQVNAESGKVSFIGPESGRFLSAFQALHTFLRPQDPAMALAKRFASEFGVKSPERDLSVMKNNHGKDGRLTVRYQQKYHGIPIMGGELIVNTNDNGDLYSMNGEVSPNLSLPTQPRIDSAQARETALQSMAKWYQKSPEDFIVTEPELWIYDESLLQPSTKPVELVWRMELTPKDIGTPVRELVLVNAQSGGISLHFNQIDTAWSGDKQADDAPTSTPEPPQPTETPLSAEPSNGSVAPTLMNVVPQSNRDASTLEVSHLQAANLGNIFYVATTGSDGNDCRTTLTPCATISGAIGKAADGDIIEVAIGTYTGTWLAAVWISKNVNLSGGWNSAFTAQTGSSTIDGQNTRLGIWVDSANGMTLVTTTMDRFTIQNGYNGAGGSGGGIYNNGDFTITNSTIQNNSAGFGAGIYNNRILTVNDSVVTKNSAGAGGGIYNNYPLYNPSLNNTTISDNSATYGGGIYNWGSFTLNNVTVSGNTAWFAGGGIYNIDEITLQNSILARNLATSSGPDCSGGVGSLGYNLIGNNSGCSFTSTTGDLVGTSVSPIKPYLNSLQDNGGPTFTHALGIGSPAVDAGNSATCLPADQRGVTRPVGAKCDIGAYEGSVPFVPSPRVNTYNANNSSSLPGAFLCNQSQQPCTINNANPHADAAHKYAIGTFNFYGTHFNRDSIDNNGMVIESTVHYCDPYYGCPYANAFWDGEQMVYGDAYGYPLADDVVAHELTHGVTQYESNLMYLYQSGAINESLSDVFGEYYDQTNGQGTDTSGVRWLLGEDVLGLGALRSMSNPPTYGDPDKMRSPLYDRTPAYSIYWDNGGVHTNSGVNNKAVYLTVNGGTFNGKTVTGLGWDKVGAIYYEANTNLLSSGADYSDLYYALQQACTNLIGQKGITTADCAEVKDAIDAVEMNLQPVTNYNTDAPLCTATGTVPIIAFADDLENGLSNWTFTSSNYPRWQLDSPYGQYAQSGNHSLYAYDMPDILTDAKAQLKSVVVPANAYLHFAQAYQFEYDAYGNYDGGVLEYSTNGGASWLDAGSLMDYNGYTGTIARGWYNPIEGRSAFAGSSHGYISTRLNLVTLAGQTVSFRWRMGLDTFGAGAGWWVDNIQVYKCIKSTISGNADIGGVTLTYTDGSPQFVTADDSGNYSISVPMGWSGIVTPHKIGYSFTPASKRYSNVQGDQTDQNYIASVCASCADKDTVGVFRPSNGLLYLKNLNITGFADVAINYGLGGDYPVVGDWDGDGTVTIGIYRNGFFYLRNSNTLGFADWVFPFGQAGDQPIAGDWNGDGIDTIGIFRPSNGQFLLRNSNDAGPADAGSFFLGNPGDVGIAGDWTGKGFDTVGVFRPVNGIIFLKNTNESGFADIALNYGIPGDRPVTGDWNNDGMDTIGVYRNNTFYLRNSNTVGFADLVFSLGNPGDMPIAGDWDALP